MNNKKYPRGGAWLIEEYEPAQIFTPEDFNEEHKMISRTTSEFMENEVFPKRDEIEAQKFEIVVELLRKAGKLGLLSIDIPEKYGGLGLDLQSSLLVTEQIGKNGSFATTHGAHAGIGTLPIVYFGNDAQKERYLPRIATAEIISSYSITEPHAGSDALAAKTTAVLTEDKRHYILNGTKMWLSNAGIADIYITFTKVDGEHYSLFIVEKGMEGVSTGAEEKKMGLKGSSTRQLILENVKVPVENLLGDVGKGHIIAFNILNIGRLKLGASTIGGSKEVMQYAIRYAKERKQFGQPICEFGLIKQKIAAMGVSTYAGESMLYRTGGLINNLLSEMDGNSTGDSPNKMKAIEEYAVECSMIKVYCTEIVDYVVDEAVQIHGGYGFSEEYPVAMPYRDARINRIFEGTNEINRLMIPGMLLKRAMKGEVPLTEAAMKVLDEILSGPALEEDDTALFGREKKIIRNAKKIALMIAGSAVQKYADKIAEEQEILGYLSDIMMDTFAMESTLLRSEKIVSGKGESDSIHTVEMTQVFVSDAINRIDINARKALASFNEGDTLRTQLTALRRFTRHTPINTTQLSRRIAERLTERGGYFV